MQTQINKRFHAVLGKYRISEENKKTIIYSHTRKTSAALLTDSEALSIIRAVERDFTPKQKPDQADKIRKQLIAIGCQDLSWSVGKVKQWCENNGKKKFNQYSVPELITLRETLRKIVAHYIQKHRQ